jgi:eukaryotic-like serine/threonine-protein kinase
VVPDIVCGYRLLRELGARALPAYAAIDPKPRRPEDALCVVERLARDPGVDAEAAAVFMRDAKRLSQVRHANLVRVRDVVVGTSTVLLVTDWLDGELFSDIAQSAAEQGIPIPLAGSLRIVLDLLEGLSALHEVRDAKREPLQIVHAEVAPRNIVVGVDGRAVLVRPLRPPQPDKPKHARDAIGYLAPEVLLGDQTADQRADVYGAGVLLWEALTGERMHPDGEDAGEIVMRILGGKIQSPRAPVDAAWAAPLADAARKAVSPDPSVRFSNATQMLAAVRHVVGARVAPTITVSALVEAVAGQRIRTRNAALGSTPNRARLPSESAWTTEAAAPIATPRAHPSPFDLEATKVPPPSAPRAISSRPRVTPSSGTRSPSAATSSGDRTPLRSVDPETGEVTTAHPSEAPSGPMSADIVEVVEMDVPPDRPSNGSRQPPPVPPPRALPGSDAPRPLSPTPAWLEADPVPRGPGAPSEPLLTQSRTDMGSVRAPPAMALGHGGAKLRWTIATVCALIAAGVLWVLIRPAESERLTDPPGPSAAASATPPAPTSVAPAPVATEGATAPSHSSNDPDPFEPPPGDDVPRPASRSATPSSPPIPVVSATAAPASAPAAPPPQMPAGAAPAASSTHSKKRVYDPMGI